MASTPPPPSRFSRVQAILNEIQGRSVPEYQGLHAFWLDHATLLSASLYGQRLIAPPPGGDPAPPGGGGCCGTSGGSPGGDLSPGGTPTEPGEPGDAAGLAARAVSTFSDWKNPDADCYPTGGSGGAGGGSDTSRSDASGLIRGLRGQAPFDGSMFPALLWDATRAATEGEIAFIAEWIDAGAPEADGPDAPASGAASGGASVAPDHGLRLAHGDAAHAPSDKPVNADRADLGALKVRKDVTAMTPDELRRLRAAITCLQQYDGYWLDERGYDYWARIHTNSCQHGWEQFLPWHRLYLYFFEQALQDVDPHVTLPYWDWTEFAAENNLQTTQIDTGVIPHAYRCWLDDEGLAALRATDRFTRAELRRLKKLVGPENAHNSGARFLKAARIDGTPDTSTGTPRWTAKVRAIYDELVRVNPLWFPDRWPGALGSPQHYPQPEDIAAILAIPSFPDFGGGPSDDHYYGKLEETHNGMHNFAGGLNPFYSGLDPQAFEDPQVGYMVENRVTTFDPIFWAHHSNIDRLWARWQELHPGAGPQALDDPLVPWPMTARDALDWRTLGYEYVKQVHVFPTDAGRAMVRFRSTSASVPTGGGDGFRKAEVRLHRVRRGDVANADLRVFLNDPSADASTPTVGNPHYAGHHQTFHTRCYGGPGHCADPLPRRATADHRPLHHHEPRNIRVDVTDTARALLADGADELSVHVVAVGLDGKPADDALYLDAVSLTFHD